MKFTNRIKKHFLKLVSLFAAFVVWVYVINSARIKFEKTLKIDYILPENLVFSQKPITEVTYILEGPRAFLRTLLNNEDVLKIDLTKDQSIRKGFYLLQDSDISFPPGVSVDRILPRRLPIRIERRSLKNVTVRIDWAGELPAFLNMTDVVIDPPEVEVSGPRSLITILKDIPTKSVEKERTLTQNIISLELLLPDDRLELTNKTNATVSYQLRANKSNQIYGPIKPVLIGQGESKEMRKGFMLKLWVVAERLNRWDQIKGEIQLIVRIPDESSGKVWVTPIVSLPKGVYLREMTPERILVNVP